MQDADQKPPISANDMQQDRDNRENEFELLKSWHMATLREQANDLPGNLTPAALINADKQQIERLIISSARAATSAHSFNPPATNGTILWSFAISLGAAALAVYFQTNAPMDASFAMLAKACLCVSIAGTAVACALTCQCLKILNSIGSSLANASAEELNAYDKLAVVTAEVVQQRDQYIGGENLIVDASADLLCCFDSDGRVRAANKGTLRILGRQIEEVIGCDLVALILADDRHTFDDALRRAKEGQKVTRLEIRVLSKFRQAIDLRFSISWSASSKLFFARGQDITSEKKLERARAEFVSTMAHDIKIPLTSVLLGLQFLVERSEQFDAKSKQTIVRAEGNLERLIGLIDELLEYERSTQHGKMPLRYGSTSLRELIDDALDAVLAQAEEKQIKLTKSATDITLLADEGKLQRVIINLLSNAIKFSPVSAEVMITAEFHTNTVMVHVSDSGPGIPEDYRQLIFERYERMPISRDVEGTGLGLSICKAIVEAHGGVIGVSSSQSGGSDFWFNLPIKPS